MPQAVVLAGLQYGLPALGLLGGAKMQAGSADKAAKIQAKTSADAMHYQEKQEWRAREDYRRQYEDWQQRFYGGAPVATPAAAPVAAAPVAGAVPPAAAPGAVPAAEPGATPLMGNPALQGRTMADLAPWNARNFGQYLGQGGR